MRSGTLLRDTVSNSGRWKEVTKMFEQSLLENAARSGWKKALAVVISTTFQVALLMLLVVMPLIFPESVPKLAAVARTWLDVPQPPQPITDRLPKHRPQGGSGG